MRSPSPEEPTSGSIHEIRAIAASRGEPSRTDLQSVLGVIGRHKWSILFIALMTLGVALYVSSLQTDVYESRARVLVTAIEEVSSGSVSVQRPNLATEAELVSSVAVADIVAERLGIRADRDRLVDGLSVAQLGDTDILDIRYRFPDPEGAERRAQGFADGYLEYRRQIVTAAVNASAEELDRQIEELRRRFQVIQRQLATLPSGDSRVLPLRNEAALIQDRLLERQLARLEVASASATVGDIVEPARVPASPVSPNHVLNGGLGLAVGLVLGIGSAFVRDRLSERLRSATEVEDYLAAPVLGSIHQINEWRSRKKALLVSLERWRSPPAESYRSLRTNLLSAASAYGVKSVVVTSPSVGEGKTATIANLAVVLARAGKHVSIVSADLRRPRLHQFFGIDGDVGLTDVLSGHVPLRGALQKITLGTSPWIGQSAVYVWILPSGRTTEEQDLLTPDAMERVINELESVSDFVLIDVPPVIPVTDALVVAPVADCVLLVVGPRSITRSTIVSTRQRLDRVGARILGAVLNGHGGTGFDHEA